MNRRTFLGTAAASALSLSGQVPFSGGRKPNLLYIVVDQLSGLALPGIDPNNTRMPSLQRFMGSGVVFSNACTAGMTCGPSRASMDTGLYSQTLGVDNGTLLERDLPTLPNVLEQNGYTLSYPDRHTVESEHNFSAMHERWLGELGYPQPLTSLGGSQSLASYLDLPLQWKCGRAGLAPEHGFDAFCAQRAMSFMEANRNKPFACFLQLRGPHDAYLAPRPYDTLVDPASVRLPQYRAGEMANKPLQQRRMFESQGAAKMTDAQLRQIMALYYGMAAYSDVAIGKVLTRLDELNLADNTVVVLLADHGDMLGTHRFMSKGFAFYESAMRIPMIFRAPGRKGGQVNSDPVSGIDVFPTVCDLMGLSGPSAGIPGQSLVKRWEGKEKDPTRVVFASQGTPGKNRGVMMRTPHYKLTRYDEGGGELYDLVRDPNEFDNLIGNPAAASIRVELERQLGDWERQYPHRA